MAISKITSASLDQSSGAPANVVAICNAAWTPEVIAAYEAQLSAQQPAV